MGFGGRHDAAGEEQVLGEPLADGALQSLRRADGAAVDLGEAEGGALGGDDEIGSERDFAAGAVAGAVDGGDDRLGATLDRLIGGETGKPARAYPIPIPPLALLQVGAGTKHRPLAFDDDTADIGIGIEALKLAAQSLAHGQIDRVAGLGSQQLHTRNPVGSADLQGRSGPLGVHSAFSR